MNLKCKLYYLVLLIFMLNANVYAGSGSGKVQIQHVGGFGNGRLVFFYTTNHTDRPACNTYNERWVLNLDDVAGREQYSLLLAAQSSGKDVLVGGNGTFDLWQGNDSEDVKWVGFPVVL